MEEINQDFSIESVKISGTGYIVNGNMNVPADSGNRHFKAVEKWLETNEPEPEFSGEEIARLSQLEINRKAEKYLADTDWLVIRELETGKPMPEEIKAEREEFRLQVVAV